MVPKFVQFSVSSPQGEDQYYVIVALAEDGSIWKARVLGYADKVENGWVQLSAPGR